MSETLRQDIASGSKEGDTVRVIASRSHAGDVFEVAESSFEGYKKVEKIVAAGSGYKALQVDVSMLSVKALLVYSGTPL